MIFAVLSYLESEQLVVEDCSTGAVCADVYTHYWSPLAIVLLVVGAALMVYGIAARNRNRPLPAARWALLLALGVEGKWADCGLYNSCYTPLRQRNAGVPSRVGLPPHPYTESKLGQKRNNSSCVFYAAKVGV